MKTGGSAASKRRRGPWIVSVLAALIFHLGVAAIPVDVSPPGPRRLDQDTVVEVALAAPAAPPQAESIAPEQAAAQPPAAPPTRAQAPPRRTPQPNPSTPDQSTVEETSRLPEPSGEPPSSPAPSGQDAETVAHPSSGEPRAPMASQTSVLGETSSSETGEIPQEMLAYGRMLAGAVQAQQRYPQIARRMRLSGVVHLRLQVLPSGQLAGEPLVNRSSGVDVLDREAIRMVRAAAPFPPLPPELAGRSAEFPLPIRFELR